MNRRRYTTTLSLSIGGDVPTWEGEATVSYAVAWGRPEAPPTYCRGGLPADPDDVEDLRVEEIDGVPVWDRLHGERDADTIQTEIEGNDLLMCELLASAAAEDADDATDAAERRHEDARERF